MLSDDERAAFAESGYLVVRDLVSREDVNRLRDVARRDWKEGTPPLEYESEVSRPDEEANGEDSRRPHVIRRLGNAFVRDPSFYRLLTGLSISSRLRGFLETDEVVMPLGHHNCIMTKGAHGGSETKWHQDFRYWHFPTSNLVSVWLALGEEYPGNGCLKVIPGSHREAFDPSSFDSKQFFRTDHVGNERFLKRAVPVELNPGDVLFFHCLTLHSAGPNRSSDPKFSAVFTFRDSANVPTAGSRSASCGEFVLPKPEKNHPIVES